MTPSSALAWHQSRRRSQIPTVSFIVGALGAALECWQDWCTADDRSVVLVDQSQVEDWSLRWLTAAGQGTIHQALLRRLERSGITPTRLSSLKTAYDVQCFLQSHSAESDKLLSTLTHAAVVGESLLAAVASWPADQLLPQLVAFDPNLKWPSLFIVGSPWTIPDILRQWIDTAPDFLSRLPVALTVTSWDRTASTQGTDRYQSVLNEGLIEVQTLDRAEFVQALQTANIKPLPPDETIDYLVTTGVTQKFMEHYIQAYQESSNLCEDGMARSQDERYLFQLLQRSRVTHGLFRLNQSVEFLHGRSAAEADLLAESLRLVVEVDGGYYHLKVGQYRSDRQKDWLYQLHGYWVLRFLAEDIRLKPREVMTAIEDAVRILQQRLSP